MALKETASMKIKARNSRWAVLAVGLLAACGSDVESPENVAESRAALADPAAVMGFEASAHWSTTGGALGTSTTHSQGTNSLSITQQGYIELTSVALGTLSGTSQNLALDIRLPQTQPNPYWYGQVQMYLSIPSQGVYNEYLGAQELTGLPLQTFKTLSFVIPNAVVPKLSQSYSDLTFKIALNTPSGTARQYLMDNLRFVQGSGLVWPNAMSQKTSDPWIAQNHAQITKMQPRILALNFVNNRSMQDMTDMLNSITAATREGTRHKGAENPAAPSFLDYQIPYKVDLRDAAPPPGFHNSSKYPREEPVVEGRYGFDYEKLFTQEYAELFNIPDPQNPTHKLTLCELSERGLVHEVWMYASADGEPNGGAAEILGIQPRYDANGVRIPGAPMNRCSGNGCFDEEDVIPASCSRTLRIGFIAQSRGSGCYLESLSHGVEAIGLGNNIPYLTPYFREFGGFDYDQRYSTQFGSWYACDIDLPDCVTFTSDHSVSYNVRGPKSACPITPCTGTIPNYVPACGNAHFAPNSNEHYDVTNTTSTLWTCNSYRTNGGPGPNGADPASPINANAWMNYAPMAPDCVGGWLIYWWQRMPGMGTSAKDATGATMKNWWPFMFY
jgi:hypothetical protein